MTDINAILNAYPHSEEIERFDFKSLCSVVDKLNSEGIIVSNAFNVFMRNFTDICSNEAILNALKNSGVYDILISSVGAYCKERKTARPEDFAYGFADLFSEVLSNHDSSIDEGVVLDISSFVLSICVLAYKLPEKTNSDCIASVVIKHAIYNLRKNAIITENQTYLIEEKMDKLIHPAKSAIVSDASLQLLADVLIIFLNRMCWSFMCYHLYKNSTE